MKYKKNSSQPARRDVAQPARAADQQGGSHRRGLSGEAAPSTTTWLPDPVRPSPQSETQQISDLRYLFIRAKDVFI